MAHTWLTPVLILLYDLDLLLAVGAALLRPTSSTGFPTPSEGPLDEGKGGARV
jgi:hypothetical protein